MTTSIPTLTENNPFLNSVSTSNTQTPEPLRKINKLTILSIVTIVATTLCTAAGIIGAIVTGISGLFALPVVTILLAIAVLIAIHKNRSSKELSIQRPSPSTPPVTSTQSRTASETKDSEAPRPATLEELVAMDSHTPKNDQA